MEEEIDLSRRNFLVKATASATAICGAFAATPFIQSWFPSAKTKAFGAPVEVDISKLEVGAQMSVAWRGKPIWIVRRSKETLSKLESLSNALRDPHSLASEQPDYTKNIYRSLRDEFLVLVGLCTHLGCVPLYKPIPNSLENNWPGGFFCPCHGSKFDLSGRVYKGVPAPTNLVIPDYKFISDTTILIGESS